MAARETMLTLKAGILMSSMSIKNRCTTAHDLRTNAFTFVEVIIALTIVSISLLALIRLHIISISMAEKAEIMSQAVFLADEKIAETLASGYPKEGVNSGTVEKNDLTLNWQTEVTDLQLPRLEEADIAGLRKVSVNVCWKHGTGQKHLQMSTYVADRKLQ
jgi:type II secretion system protein I